MYSPLTMYCSCFNKEDIESMVNEAEKYGVDDKKQRSRVSTKNSLENHCSNMMKSTFNYNLQLFLFTINV